MLQFPRGTGPGTWTFEPLLDEHDVPLPQWYSNMCHRIGDAKFFVLIECPNGHLRTLSATIHTIGPGGEVAPSLVCGHGCDWHVFVRLVDWPPTPL